MACFLLGAVETSRSAACSRSSTATASTATRSSSPSPAPTLPPGSGSGFPVSGGMSQSLVNEGGGARTPLSGLFASGVVLVVALFFAGLLRAAAAGARRDRAVGRERPAQAVRAGATLAVQPRRARHGPGRDPGRARLRAPARRAVRRRDLRAAAAPRVAAPHHRAGPGSGTDYFADAVRHPENERGRTSSSSAWRGRCSTSTPTTCATASSSCSTRAAGESAWPFSSWASPAVDLAGAEMLERAGAGAARARRSRSGWPRRTATSGSRCAAPGFEQHVGRRREPVGGGGGRAVASGF